MATSGSTDFNQTRTEIIEDALQLLGIYGIGRSVSAEDMAFCNRILNKMVKTWQSHGIHLWASEEAYLFVTDGTGSYSLGNGASDAKAALRADTVLTQLNGALSTSATAVTVDSTTGMTAADVIGIVLDDDTIHWTTIASIGSSTTLTLTSGVASAASDNANVYTYTTKIPKPLRLHGMRRVTGIGTSASSIPMTKLSQQDYFDLPSKNITGAPTHFYYNPDLSNGRLYLWPCPDNVSTHFELSFDRPLEDLDSATDNADFPSEWLEVLTYQLAVRIAPAFGKDQKASILLAPIATDLLEQLKGWDSEACSLFVTPSND